MTAVELLSYLRDQGVAVWAESDRLRYVAKKGIITPDLHDALSRHKAELLVLVRGSAPHASSLPVLRPRAADLDQPPLSFAQQRLWFLDRLVPGNPFYCESNALRFTVPLSVPELEWSLNEIVRRHESLRTTFDAVNGQPRQIIAPTLYVPLAMIDLRALPPAEREVEAQRLAAEEAQQPFDLAVGPLMRATLVHLDESDYAFLLTLHHIICDGWSLQVLFQELSTLYQAACEGAPSPLPELPIQYADFAAWQREWLQGEVLASQLAYWTRQLTDAPVLQLPTDFPRPRMQSFRGARRTVTLSPALSRRLHALSQQENVTPFMTMLAAFKVLLHRYSGQTDIVVGSPIANRTRVELEGLIGFFVNTLVLRTDLSGDPPFREALRRVREVAVGAFAHQDLPFEKLVEELQPERDLSRNPLCQVALQLLNLDEAPGEASDDVPGWIDVESSVAKLDLRFDVWSSPEGFDVQIEYCTDLFEADTIARMGGHFATLLESIVAEPDRRLSQLRLLTDADRQQISTAWNDTASAEKPRRCIHELVEMHAARTPERLAAIFGDERLTYGELNARANQLAHHLRSLGVGPEHLVGLCLERSLHLLVGVIGVLKAGAAFVPIDLTYPDARTQFMFEDSGVRVLVTEEQLRERVDGRVAEIVAIDANLEIDRQATTNPVSGVKPENVAYVVYTSGSTGRPKGVLVPHRGVCNIGEVQQRALDVGPADRVLQFASLSFDASMCEMSMALTAGAALCLADHHSLLPGPTLTRLLRDQQVTAMLLPPSALAALPVDDLPALRILAVEGEAFSGDLVTRWSRPGRAFANMYGPTETTIFATLGHLDDARPHIGRPVTNVRVYVLDRWLEPVPIAVPGELHIGGLGVTRGYLNRPDLTAERFIPDPFGEPGGRLYKTGDLVRHRPDGTLEFLGRVDHQVKIRGFRIELGEIESWLAQHPDVTEAIVVAREDVPGDKRLVAYVMAPAHAPTTTALRQFLRQRLPEFMVPSTFVLLDAVPLTPNGKVDRAALPPPDKARPTVALTYVAPHTELEGTLTHLWRELLGLERVGTQDNFFDLGGHSLLIVRMQSRLEALLGAPISVVDLFRYPTISALAGFLADGRTTSPPPPDLLDRAEKQRQAMARGRRRMHEGMDAHD